MRPARDRKHAAHSAPRDLREATVLAATTATLSPPETSGSAMFAAPPSLRLTFCVKWRDRASSTIVN